MFYGLICHLNQLSQLWYVEDNHLSPVSLVAVLTGSISTPENQHKKLRGPFMAGWLLLPKCLLSCLQ